MTEHLILSLWMSTPSELTPSKHARMIEAELRALKAILAEYPASEARVEIWGVPLQWLKQLSREVRP